MYLTHGGAKLSPRLQAMRTTTIGAPKEIGLIRAQAFTDAVRTRPDLSRGEQLALGLRWTFDRLPIAIDTEDRIVGAPTEKLRGAILYPELKSDFLAKELENFSEREQERFVISPEEKRRLREEILPVWVGHSGFDEMLARQSDQVLFGMRNVYYVLNNDFSSASHLAHINYSRVLEVGFAGIIAQARSAMEQLHADDPEAGTRAAFYRSVIISGEAMIALANRYAQHAATLADQAESDSRRQELLEIAATATRVPAQPARSFREAVQAYWFTLLGLMQFDGAAEIPLGRLDQLLCPYYRQDLVAGRLTRPEAFELLAELLIKLNRVTYLHEYAATKVVDGNSLRYTLTVGGVDETGSDATNPLSELLLEGIERVGLTSPNLAVRLHPRTPAHFMDRVIHLATNGSNLVQVFNDTVIIAGFERVGFPAGAARDYIITGCVQPLPASTYGPTCSAHINGPKVLELLLNGGRPFVSLSGEEEDLPPPGFDSYADLWDEFTRQLRTVTEEALTGLRVVGEVQDRLLPNPLLSALSDGPLAAGRDVKAGGAEQNATGITLVGLGTLADSLAALKEMVFDRRTHTLAEVVEWIKTDFEEYEPERQMLLNHPPKFGNGDHRVDQIAREIVNSLAEAVSEHRPYRGGLYTVGLHSETHHVIQGVAVAATPDGRRSGEMLGPGCGPTSGMERLGPTAALRSLAAVDYTMAMGGASANLRFNPTLLRTGNQREQFGAMLKAYFKLGGQHLQVNVIDAATLREAQHHPERYQDLIVRVTGYSARFVDLTPGTQEEIIRRAEMNLCR
ncbi:MAG: pyruvate formate lyase family protein [Bacillota bacterium]